MKTTDLFLGIIVLCVIVIALSVAFDKPQQFRGFAEDAYYAKNASSTAGGYFWASSTAFTISRNSSRSFARITLDILATSTVFVNQGTSTDYAQINKGIALNSMGTSTPSFYQIDRSNPYRGELQIISSGNARVYWIEQ